MIIAMGADKCIGTAVARAQLSPEYVELKVDSKSQACTAVTE
jgi:hypothetical protein